MRRVVQLRGVFPALVTPIDAHDRVSVTATRKLVQMNLAKGVDGFYVGGSTGEAFLLSLDERKQLLETVVSEAKGKATIIAHVGCIGTRDAAELARHAYESGADAVSSLPPFYYEFSFAEIRDFYNELVDAASLPLIVYNIPARTGFVFSSGQWEELFRNPGIVGVKHTSMDLYQLERIKRLDEQVVVFNGHDEVFLGGLTMGADGGIGSTYNIMAERFLQIHECFQTDYQQAHKLQLEVNEIISTLIEVGVMPGVKYVLRLLGVDCGECRRPFGALTDNHKRTLTDMAQTYF